jgi:hypothetical protein
MKKFIIFLLFFSFIFVLTGCKKQVKNSNIISETSEVCSTDTGDKLDVQSAIESANKSECVKHGAIKEDCTCNEHSGTCWLEMELKEETKEDYPGCNPACVVNVETKEAEINWRCTGLITE